MPQFCLDVSNLRPLVSFQSFEYLAISLDLTGDNATDSRAAEFIHLLNSPNLVQLASSPTHNRGRTPDLLISEGVDVDISSVLDAIVGSPLHSFLTSIWRPRPQTFQIATRFNSDATAAVHFSAPIQRRHSSCTFSPLRYALQLSLLQIHLFVISLTNSMKH